MSFNNTCSKGVTHTYDSYGYCATSLAQALNATKDDVIFPGSSYSHTAGFVFSMAGLAVGAKIVVAAAGTADIFLPLAREVKPTIGFFLPSLLLTIIRDDTSTKETFDSLRLLVCGGDKVPSNLQLECHALTGKYVCEAYGMSEAVPITIQSGDESDEKRSSIGKPAPGCSISIRDVQTKKELPHGENGRMWISGPLVMQGYWGNPEATAETIVDGWLDTGDVVSIDKDGSGYIRFAGRQKQIIVHQGSNISPLEVEGGENVYTCGRFRLSTPPSPFRQRYQITHTHSPPTDFCAFFSPFPMNLSHLRYLDDASCRQ